VPAASPGPQVPPRTGPPESRDSSRCVTTCRLAAERGVFGQGGRHAVGGAVDRGREPTRPCAHDQQIAHAWRIRASIATDAQRVQQGAAAGVPQHRPARHDNDRQIRDRDIQALQDLLRLGQCLQVQPDPDQPVARQDLQQPPRVRVETRSDQGQAGAAAHQDGATQQQCPQDQVTQAGLLRHDPAHLRHRNCQHPPCGSGDGAQERALPRQHADLAEKLRRTEAGDHTCPRPAVTLNDVGRAREQHDQVIRLVAIGEQHITRSHLAFAAIPAQHPKLGRIQHRGTPRKRDQAIAAAAGRPRGSSMSSASQAGCVCAHRKPPNGQARLRPHP
jgi:hypothetical protein